MRKEKEKCVNYKITERVLLIDLFFTLVVIYHIITTTRCLNEPMQLARYSVCEQNHIQRK